MTLFDGAFPGRLRPALAKVPAYAAGKPAPVIPGLTTYKVSSNENPYPPLASVIAAMSEAAGRINRYPDMSNTEVLAAIGARYDYPANTVAVGPGSTGVLVQLIGALCDPDDEVVFAWRSFEAYPIVVPLAGAKDVRVPLTPSGEHDLDAMAAAITDRTQMVILCTPNNPTGPIITHEAAQSFMKKVPAHVTVILDEAYVEFVRDEDAVDGFALQRDYPNLVIMRTFSKAYGLAGARIGYCLAHPTLAEAVAKTSIPFSVNLIAQAAAVASLQAEDELTTRVDEIVAERNRVTAALKDQGWQLPSTQSNFVYFPLGEGESEAFDEACLARGLMARRYGTEGVRVTIGEPEANTRLLEITASLNSHLRKNQ